MEPRFPTYCREVYIYVKIQGRFRVFQCLDSEVTARYIREVIEYAENKDYPHANPLKG